MLLTTNSSGQKVCRATFFAISPSGGVSPVQVLAETDSVRTFPDGSKNRLQAGAEVRVTLTGSLLTSISGSVLELGAMKSDATAVATGIILAIIK